MNKSFFLILCAFLVTVFQLKAQVSTVTISNSKLKLQYFPGKKLLEVTDRASGKVFLRQGQLLEASGKTIVVNARHPEFGEGKELRVTKVGGGFDTVGLYAKLPFVLVQ